MADELEGASADELEQGERYSVAKSCMVCIELLSAELTDLRRKQHDNDIEKVSYYMPEIRNHKNDLPDLFHYNNVKAIAIDTETAGLHLQRDRLCVVQISPGCRISCIL